MRYLKSRFIFFLFLEIIWPSYLLAQKKLSLWYTTPAKTWVEALPLGDGKIGAMIFGDAHEELIQLNESSLWSGRPIKTNINPDALQYLPQIRKALLKDENYTLANQLTRKLQGNYTESYMPLGDLKIVQQLPVGKQRNYRRELDISNAVSSVSFSVAGIQFNREYFISAPKNVMVIRLKASRQKALTLDISAGSQLHYHLLPIGNELILNGKAPVHVDPNYYNPKGKEHVLYQDSTGATGMRFQYRVKAVIKTGKIKTDSSGIHIKGSDEVLLLLRLLPVLTASTMTPTSRERTKIKLQVTHY